MEGRISLPGWLEGEKGVWGIEGFTETSLEMLGVGFNTMLPGGAQRTRGTGVCDRGRKGIFRQEEPRSTGWEHRGHRTRARRGLGGRAISGVMIAAAAAGLWARGALGLVPHQDQDDGIRMTAYR